VIEGNRLPEEVRSPSVSSSTNHDLDSAAHALYRRYGAHPWSNLPETTREHFRSLVRAGIDGAGRPLA
jgi:hypothetical protein